MSESGRLGTVAMVRRDFIPALTNRRPLKGRPGRSQVEAAGRSTLPDSEAWTPAGGRYCQPGDSSPGNTGSSHDETNQGPGRRSQLRLLHLAILIAIVSFTLIGSATASAHAYIVRTNPAANATVQTAPSQINIWFTEPIQAPPHAITVTGPSGNQLQQGEAKVSSSDSTELTVPIKTGSQGTYTVEWHAISADTHPVGGTYQFSVGGPSATPTKVSTSTANSTSNGTTAFAAFSRWLLLIGLAAIIGPLAYMVVVLGDAIDPPIEQRLWKIGLAGAIIAVAAAPVMLIAQAEGVAGSLGGAFGGSLLRDLLTGIYGKRWIARTVISLLILGLVIWRLLRARRSDRPSSLGRRPHLSLWAVAGLTLAAALMVFTSLNGHAATTKPVWLSVLLDWLHLGAAAIWIGGLIAFVVAVLPILKCRSAGDAACLLGRVVPRFSTVALVCVEVLIVTGLYATWAHVGGTALLTSTGYGETLLVKLGLVVIVLGFAAVNLLVTRPKLAQAGDSGGDEPENAEVVRRFRHLVSVEAFLGIVILAVVGVLTSLAPAETPPAIAAATPPAPPPLTLAHNAGPNLVVLSLAPATPGPNIATVQLTSMLGQPLPGARVRLSATPPRSNEAAPTLTTMAETKDGYQASLSLPGSGTWKLKAIVDAPGQPETSTTFSVSLPLPSVAQELAEVDAAMNRLTSLTEHNSLSNGQSTVVTIFNYQAPNSLHYTLTAPGRSEESIIIGNTRYDKVADGHWQASVYPNYKWPDFSYAPTASQVTLIGQQTIDGVLCDEITWYDAPSNAHFTIWAGQKDHRIRRLQMMATAHYMTVEYSGFNSSPSVTAPKASHH